MSKKILFAVLSIASLITAQAQEFQGMAVYESKTSTAEFKARIDANKNITPEMRKTAEERMSKMFQKTFILNFDKTASTYKEEEKLDTPIQADGAGRGMRMMSSMIGGGTLYKNIKDKNYTVDKEFMGKEFLIKDTLRNLKWKMEGETRVIGGYNCFKATAVLPTNKSDIRNYRPKPEETDKKKSDPNAKKEDPNKKTNFMDEMNVPKETIVTAWYTPEIPVNQGPETYWGLPGLILEINDGRTVILCSKVVLNPKEKAVIKASTKGKVVTQAEYDEIVIKKMEEFRNMNSNNRNSKIQRKIWKKVSMPRRRLRMTW